MPRLTPDEIEARVAAALRDHGATAEIAASVAAATAHSEAHGNVICGLAYVPSYCAALDSGRVDGRAVPAVDRRRLGAVMVDAARGFAQPAFDAGLEDAVAAARSQGIALYGIERSHTCTSLGYFTDRLARRGLIALGFTNASAVVAPPGGARPMLGTNPVAFSVPGPDGPVIHYDAATSACALGAVKRAKAAGEPIPQGWAVDASGVPTTDPAAMLEGGALMSAGGYKGFGLGLMVEVLAAGLTGSRPSTEVAGLLSGEGPPHGLGQVYLLIDPGLSPGFEAVLASVLAVGDQTGARLPGAGRAPLAKVDVPEEMWVRIEAL